MPGNKAGHDGFNNKSLISLAAHMSQTPRSAFLRASRVTPVAAEAAGVRSIDFENRCLNLQKSRQSARRAAPGVDFRCAGQTAPLQIGWFRGRWSRGRIAIGGVEHPGLVSWGSSWLITNASVRPELVLCARRPSRCRCFIFTAILRTTTHPISSMPRRSIPAVQSTTGASALIGIATCPRSCWSSVAAAR